MKDSFRSIRSPAETVKHPIQNQEKDRETLSESSEEISDGQGQIAELRQTPADTTDATPAHEFPVDRAEVIAKAASYGQSIESTTACFSAIDIVSQLPPNSQLELVSCIAGRFQLSAFVTGDVAIASVEEGLSEHLEQIASTVRKTDEQSAHLFLSGEEMSARKTVLETLNSARAKAFFAEVEYWADLCGIDDIDLGDQSVIPAEEGPARWRRRLVGTGSYGQIQSFLDRVSARSNVAALGELILTPVSGADSYNKAVRISSAIDVSIGQ